MNLYKTCIKSYIRFIYVLRIYYALIIPTRQFCTNLLYGLYSPHYHYNDDDYHLLKLYMTYVQIRERSIYPLNISYTRCKTLLKTSVHMYTIHATLYRPNVYYIPAHIHLCIAHI